MISLPLVSIVIPASNPEFFPLALKDAVAQTYAHVEVIVCDDSRTDEIRLACEAYAQHSTVAVHYRRNPVPLGFPGNLLEGLSHARGELVKFLCDDDRLYTECINRQVMPMHDNPDISVVVAQRYFCDRNEVRLPVRLANIPVSAKSAMFKGEDMLGIFESFPLNFLGNLSSTLFRRSDLALYLPALTAPGHCFTIMLDLALMVCALRRGNLAAINDVLVVERLHPQRFSRQQSVRDAMALQRDWLVQMLKVRSGEPAPAKGWVRFVPLEQATEHPREWEELCMDREIGRRQGVMPTTVGTASESFAEMYQEWLSCRTLGAEELKLLPDILGRWPERPRIVPVIIAGPDDSAALAVTLHSLENQHYPAELVLVLSSACETPALEGRIYQLPLQDDGIAQTNELLGQLEGADWVYLLRAGDRLTDTALLVLADRMVMASHLACVYSDEGALRDGESLDPVFKPDFNLDLLRSYPYVGRALAFNRQQLLAAGGLDPQYGELAAVDLLWKLFERNGAQVIGHAAEVLVESQHTLADWLCSEAVIAQNPQVLAAHLQRSGVECRLESAPGSLLNRPRYVHAQAAKVSIIIISADQLALVQRCVERVLELTTGCVFEIVLVDNGSVSPEARGWFAGMAQLGGDKIRVLTLEPSALASAQNLAAQQAHGDYLLYFSPYLVVTRGDWLQEMLHIAQRPEVAVVGPKVLNANGQVHQAGLILGLRAAASVPFQWESSDAPGYMQRLQVEQSLSATGIDCFMVRAEVFSTLGGFDAEHYPQASHDVDLCLRATDLGYLTVWTPHAQLATGARVWSDAERAAFQTANDTLMQRWLPRIARDPAYNPNLSIHTTSYTLEPGSRVGWSPFSDRRLPRVLAVPINASAVGHYRVTQPFHELMASGRITGRIQYDMPSIVEIERQRPDVIIFQGRYFPGADEEVRNLRRYFDCRFIYELDDLVTNVPQKNEHARHLPTSLGQVMRDCIALCDRVVVSTLPLAEALSDTHTDIRVVPNMLAPQLWTHLRSKRQTAAKPRVGWGGGTSHRGDLELIADVVRELADEVDWVFFGMCPPALRPYVHEFHGIIPLAAYPAKLASLNLDLALAPLEAHVFNDCKSNLRLLEYGACGYPVVCSDTGAYGGYLPCTRVKDDSTEAWISAIRGHLQDPQASYRMGDALRETVFRDYMLRGDNVQHWASGWLGD